jgi:hypothetical protein
MDLVLLVYGISLLTPIGSVAMMVALISVFAIVGLMIYRASECSQESYYNSERNEQRAKDAEWAMGRVGVALKVLIPTVFLLIVLPTQKTAYMMVGAYAAQKVAENGKVQETGSKVLQLINQKLDDYIDEGIAEAEQKAEKLTKKSKRDK